MTSFQSKNENFIFSVRKEFPPAPVEELMSSPDAADVYCVKSSDCCFFLLVFSPEGRRFNVSLLHLTVLQVVGIL